MSYELYVGNYPSEFNRNDIISLFKNFKGITLLKWFKKDLKTFCFLSCNDMDQVVSVIQKMNNTTVSGRKLIVRASDEKLQEYVELILRENKGHPETIKKKEYHSAKESTKERAPNSSNSPPFVPTQVLRNRTANKVPQNNGGKARETNSLHPKSPSSHSSSSERTYNPSHQRFSNNSFSTQYDDDDLSECVWLSVSNFPDNTPTRFIYELFDDYAPLKVLMLCNYHKNRTLTEAHVLFLNREVADDVIMNFDNTMYDGRILLVNDVEDLSVMKELVQVVP